MSEQVIKKPLMVGQFVWTVSKKDGRFRPIIGPDPLEATDDDIFLVQDPRDPTRVLPVDHPAAAIRNFVTLGPNEYAVIHNPAEAFTPEYPNGQYTSGRGEMKVLRHGAKRTITGGHFLLWPGQRVEVRKIHHLSASEFLMVVVESPQVDETAAYYDLTVQCAKIKKAVVDATVEGKAGGETPRCEALVARTPPDAPPTAATAPTLQEDVFRLGQRIIIPGSLTPTYIPPSGVEVVPDEAGKIVREAVVLAPTEFCVLLDEDGRPQTKQGPGRVFPGPYDRFRTEGSRNRVYDAYHVRADRGLLVRVVVDSIGRQTLAAQLPPGSAPQLEKEVYAKGDEIFLGGFGAYLVPSNAIEVVDPQTRRPHVGNDHSRVYVQAIGVDQKSGVYVADVSTGNVELMKGEIKVLLDPRRQKHVHRRVPGSMWNLMIGEGEPHKRVAPEDMVDTPWALSVIVPNNMAVLVTSKDGRRAVVGPCTELLGYEEWLEVLALSRGRPKLDDQPLETCFLRVTGNRITDQVSLETADSQVLNVDVSYGVQFEGDGDDDRSKWFNHRDPVMLMCAHLRSRLRAAAHRVRLADLRLMMPDFVRDTVLGRRPEGAGTHRPGLLLGENNMRVTEVEVLSVSVPDEEIAQRLAEVDRRVVMRRIEDDARQVELESEHRREEIHAELTAIQKAQIERQGDLESARVQSETSVAEMLRDRRVADERMAATLRNEQRQQVTAFRQGLAEIEKALLDAGAKADVQRLAAIQPRLVEAIEGLGDKQLMTALAEHLPQAAGGLGLLLGQGGIAALKKMVEGTRLAHALHSLSATSGQIEEAGDQRLAQADRDQELSPP